MDRKDFFKKTFHIGIASGTIMLFGEEKDEKKGEDMKFKEEWIKTILKNMDEQFDENTRIRLMESCGRDCARRGSIKIAESNKGNLDKMLETLAKYVGKDNIQKQGKAVHLKYSKCYCSLVNKGPARLSDTYCYCSRGWVLEMFETCAGKPVKVELKKAIKRGDPHCKFIVRL